MQANVSRWSFEASYREGNQVIMWRHLNFSRCNRFRNMLGYVCPEQRKAILKKVLKNNVKAKPVLLASVNRWSFVEMSHWRSANWLMPVNCPKTWTGRLSTDLWIKIYCVNKSRNRSRKALSGLLAVTCKRKMADYTSFLSWWGDNTLDWCKIMLCHYFDELWQS